MSPLSFRVRSSLPIVLGMSRVKIRLVLVCPIWLPNQIRAKSRGENRTKYFLQGSSYNKFSWKGQLRILNKQTESSNPTWRYAEAFSWKYLRSRSFMELEKWLREDESSWNPNGSDQKQFFVCSFCWSRNLVVGPPFISISVRGIQLLKFSLIVVRSQSVQKNTCWSNDLSHLEELKKGLASNT